ncbi:hypothetical protein B4U79_02682 [Dinothrombium tinctorium]|uniref:tRNA-uridine aminocarboxypropyltransferase 1 n=1 Tax=Dinothrombium tinctorium TaxID=1965070 RepID=A0A3S3Q8V6_9ACAR|nr:hypothetical protein B4U79_02682 [Dinothrombium tinctorium]
MNESINNIHSVIKESGIFANCRDVDLMHKLRISDTEKLNAINQRDICAKCGKSRRYYCYTCLLPMQSITEFLPEVNLPLKVDIIKHAKEVDGKSTSPHAAIIAPHHVRIFIYPDVPDQSGQRAVLVFPSESAITLEECFANYNASSSGNERKLPFDKVVFIDSTWRQTKLILNDRRVNSLPMICLRKHLSLFWRHQREKPLTYLSTIEAIYHFFVDFHHLTEDKSYDGEYDNLLFFFKHTYFKVRDLYSQKTLKARVK